MYEELGVDSVESLKIACEMGHVAPLSGFGEKSQQKYPRRNRTIAPLPRPFTNGCWPDVWPSFGSKSCGYSWSL